jgi:glycosyltransferase involved in cell wall biosynthesis
MPASSSHSSPSNEKIHPQQKHTSMKHHRPKMSIVLLTYKSYLHKGGCIEHVLETLKLQTYQNFEVIIVENSGVCRDRDRLLTYVSSLTLDVKVVETETSRGAARNQGAKLARGKNLVFLDDDTLLHQPQSLAKAVSSLKHSNHAYGAKRLWTSPLGWFEAHRDELLTECAQGQYKRILDTIQPPDPHLRGPDDPYFNLMLRRSFISNFGVVRRDDFYSVGGYPEDYDGGAGSEDDALMLKLYVRCGRPSIFKDISVIHINHALRYDNMKKDEFDNYSSENQQKFRLLCETLGVRAFNPISLFFTGLNHIEVITLDVTRTPIQIQGEA